MVYRIMIDLNGMKDCEYHHVDGGVGQDCKFS